MFTVFPNYYADLKHFSFVPLLDIGLLVGYKSFSLKPLLGNDYARVYLLYMYT